MTENGVDADARDLSTRRAELQAELDRLRAERGQRLADGKSADAVARKIEARERELAGIEDLAAELDRRARAEAAEAEARRRADLQKRVADAELDRAAAVRDGERAAEALGDALTRLHTSSDRLRRALGALGVENVVGLSDAALSRRLSGYLSRVLAGVPSATASRYGSVQLAPSFTPQGPESWEQSEARHLGAAIDIALGLRAPEPRGERPADPQSAPEPEGDDAPAVSDTPEYAGARPA